VDPAFPDVAAEFDGWRLAEQAVETLFEVPGARVRGATRRYEDNRTRTAVREAARLDHEWRFVAATRLGFEPALPAGAVPLILPMVRRQVREAFAERLAGRGLEHVSRRGDERIRVLERRRAWLTRFGARDPVAGGVPVVGLVCVWTDRDDFFVVTGGHPEGQLADLLSLADPPDRLTLTAAEYRQEFLDTVRSVS